MERDQEIDGERVKRLLRRALRQEPRIGGVAEILEQQQTRGDVLGEDARRAESQPAQQPRDRQERPHILLRRRRVHQDRAEGRRLEPLVAAEGGVAGEPAARRFAPAGGGEKSGDALGALSHRRCRRAWRPSPGWR